MIEEIKTHVAKHKFAYGVGTGIVIAGITVYIMRGRYASVHSVLDTADDTVFVRPLNFLFFSKQNQKVITVFERVGKGHPGYRIGNLDGTKEFASQNIAAKHAGVSKSMMSTHLTKRIPDNIFGEKYQRIAV